ncbi:MAG: DUF975 family protein [Bacilli bacterium]|nr:DUF975 family protein [Bacilli bacterium]
MMNRQELKEWSKNKAKSNMWLLLGMILVSSIITGFTIGSSYNAETGQYSSGYNIGFIFYFVEVGLYAAIASFVNGGSIEFKDLFKYSSDFVRCLITKILASIFIFLWTLLLIVPGIIKAFGYSLIPLLLADSKYKDLTHQELLKKSEEMMDGHKMDYFTLMLSFIGWHILAIFTCGILEIWIIPYQTVAQVKFLTDVKAASEGVSAPVENTAAPTEA